MSWFERIVPSRIKTERRTRSVPEGLWTKCPACDAVLYRAEIERNLHVCPKCSHHMRINGRERLLKFLDTGTTLELAAKVEPQDPLKFKDSKRYKDRFAQAKKHTGETDALVVMAGKLAGLDVVACAFEFRFLGGSMGSVVGEKLARLIERATEKEMPVVIISTSGGARMYEGMFSLMQMAKTSAALAYHAQHRLPYISVLTHPTTAGVMASYASLGDLILAEPGAMIGFAGPRVIKDTTQAELPPDFQTAEFLLNHGLIDAIVSRREMKVRLIEYLNFLTAGKKAADAS